MPYINIASNVSFGADKTAALKEKIARALETSMPGKTENWLMLRFDGGQSMYFGGSDAPCVMADVCVYGKQSKESYANMTAAVTEILSAECGVPAGRIYVKYTEYDKWGWNGGNF
ncbi:MAG: hypothetical protein E7576_17260 [Ruminococcaceae bacterium]|jgi:phenylpyruvate tautomerase PptA (4-oxalocrotonate tautomerase family)|nr:hypothetical protein [Oscillospiraceae bacterium]